MQKYVKLTFVNRVCHFGPKYWAEGLCFLSIPVHRWITHYDLPTKLLLTILA